MTQVLVVGVGRSGMAAAEVLRARGTSVVATDEKPREALREQIAQLETWGARFVEPSALQQTGATDGILARAAYAVLSPGVPPTSAVVRTIRAAGVRVIGEVELAFELCKAPIAAVTGTKGKSTTTALVGHLLRASGRTAYVGGNIGNPLVREVLDAKSGDWVVAEVSSFQLETTEAFRPRVAAIVNVTADHLDRYASMDEYAEAKYRIFANQTPGDSFVGNLDDQRLHSLRRSGRIVAKQAWYTAGDARGGATMYVRDGAIVYAAPNAPAQSIIALREIPIPGEHNVRNVMAALLVAAAAGCDPTALRDAVRSFAPMKHRMQPVAEIEGVLYVDDSKSTNPDSVIAALHSYDRPIVLIAGGRSKGAAFDEMAAQIDARAKAAILVGESSAEIAALLRSAPVTHAQTLSDAVRAAREYVLPGDVVLLSPGCASFDQFASAEDRGEKFTAAVLAMKEPADA
jgi:UDP-N-acetylmuramoylalanine--D-glutamate ligase